MIQLFSNSLGEEELSAVRDVLESRWLGPGQEVHGFEREWLQHLGGNGHVLLTNNCTSALHVAFRALDLGPGDEVIVPTVHFVAIPSLLMLLGATPVFADVDPHTLNILPEEICRLRNAHTAAVCLLHYGGHPCAMDRIWDEAEGLSIIEDAANAPASHFGGQACGTMGVAAAWSFDPMKILVMGDGGALWVRDEQVRARAESIRYLGLAPETRSGMDKSATSKRWWAYDVVEPSARYVSNDIAAAMGRVQLRKLPQFIERRKEIWGIYQRELQGVGDLRLPPEPLPGCASSYYLYWVQTGKRDRLASILKERGIYTSFRYYPLHLVRGFATLEPLPNAEWVNETTLCLPLHQNLTNQDVDYVVEMIKGAYG